MNMSLHFNPLALIFPPDPLLDSAKAHPSIFSFPVAPN